VKHIGNACRLNPTVPGARGLRLAEPDGPWKVERQRCRACFGDDHLAITQRQPMVLVALEHERTL
jgi:hypothetical protein